MVLLQYPIKYIHFFNELDHKTIITKLHFDHSQLFSTKTFSFLTKIKLEYQFFSLNNSYSKIIDTLLFLKLKKQVY